MPTSAPRTEAFTLVEVLVALLVLAALAALLGGILQGALRVDGIQREESAAIAVRREQTARAFAGETEDPPAALQEIQEESP
jgi:prepilin-type N-terminal cleavage/methylation domain-containing protein